MTFSFDPPHALLYIVIVILIANVGVLLLSRRHPARKALGLIVGAVLVTILLTRYYRIGTSSVAVDDTGIIANAAGASAIPWAQVRNATYITDLSASPFRPGRPENALAAFGTMNARYGWWRLVNGGRALVAVEQVRGGAVAIATADATYLFGPHDVRGLAAAIASHVALSGWGAAQ